MLDKIQFFIEYANNRPVRIRRHYDAIEVIW